MTCLSWSLYVGYIVVFIIGVPAFAWFVLLPAHHIPAFYWSSLVLDCFTNLVAITAGVLLLVNMLIHARRRPRQSVWDAVHRRWHTRHAEHVQYILDACPQAFTTEEHGVVIHRPEWVEAPAQVAAPMVEPLVLPRLLVVVPAHLESVSLAGCLVAIGQARYTHNMEVILVAQHPAPVGELPAHLSDLQTHYRARYGRALTVLIDVAPAPCIASQVQLALDHCSEAPTFVAIVKDYQQVDRNFFLLGVGLAEQHEADLVQGRAIVLNNRASLWTRIRGISYDSEYLLHHDDEDLTRGLGFMGGTSSFWRASALRSLGLSAELIHPQIDAGFRAVLSGHRVVSSLELRTYELAPVGFRGWFNSYITFSQGWFQLTIRHWWALLTSPRLSRFTRLMFGLLLLEREVCSYVATQLLPVSAASIVYYSYHRDLLLLSTTLVAVSLRPLHLLIVRLYLHLDVDAEPPGLYSPPGMGDYLLYLFLYPFTAVLRFIITAAAHLRVLRHGVF